MLSNKSEHGQIVRVICYINRKTRNRLAMFLVSVPVYRTENHAVRKRKDERGQRHAERKVVAFAVDWCISAWIEERSSY